MEDRTTVEVTRTYVQMLHPDELRPSTSPQPGIRIERVDHCSAELYRFLYGEVGRQYHWFDRRDWTDEQIDRHLAQDTISIWMMRDGETPAGFFELVRWPDGSVEIGYFGLLPDFLGRGLGKHMLTAAVKEMWRMGANRVWLHTCTLDHPSALPNYLKRGFQEVN